MDMDMDGLAAASGLMGSSWCSFEFVWRAMAVGAWAGHGNSHGVYGADDVGLRGLCWPWRPADARQPQYPSPHQSLIRIERSIYTKYYRYPNIPPGHPHTKSSQRSMIMMRCMKPHDMISNTFHCTARLHDPKRPVSVKPHRDSPPWTALVLVPTYVQRV